MLENKMTSKINLAEDKISKLFYFYFFPILFSMLSLSTHVIVDGFFVGEVLGQNAVAALGITWPVFPVLVATYLLFSVGGSALISYHLGRGEAYKSREIFSSIIYFVGILGLIVGGILFVFTEEIAVFLGSNEVLKPLVVEYLQIIFAGVVVMFLHPILDMFAVNDKQPVLAMISMVVASIGNVVFNYIFLFVMDLGIHASALSTILGNIVAGSILLWHFLSKRGDLYFVKVLKFKNIKKACIGGSPACVSEASTGILMLLYNLTLIPLAQERGVTIYTITMYAGVIFFTILLSIAQGIQPISSFNYGAGKIERVKEIYFFAIKVALITGIVIYSLFFVLGQYFACGFLNVKDLSSDPLLVGDIAIAMKIYLFAYLFMGVNLVSSIFLQSIQRPSGSMLITLCYSFGFSAPLLVILPQKLGINGVWATYPISACLTIFVVFWVLRREIRKGVLQ